MSKLIDGGIYNVTNNNENNYEIGEVIFCRKVFEETNEGLFSNISEVLQSVGGNEVKLICDGIGVGVGNCVKVVSVDEIDEVIIGLSLGDVVTVLSPPDEDGLLTVGTKEFKYGYLHISQVEGI